MLGGIPKNKEGDTAKEADTVTIFPAIIVGKIKLRVRRPVP